MKTPVNNSLTFNKSSVLELNDSNLYHVNGGSSPAVPVSVIVSIATAGATVGATIALTQKLTKKLI